MSYSHATSIVRPRISLAKPRPTISLRKAPLAPPVQGVLPIACNGTDWVGAPCALPATTRLTWLGTDDHADVITHACAPHSAAVFSTRINGCRVEVL